MVLVLRGNHTLRRGTRFELRDSRFLIVVCAEDFPDTICVPVSHTP
jgi:hypothetical protein